MPTHKSTFIKKLTMDCVKSLKITLVIALILNQTSGKSMKLKLNTEKNPHTSNFLLGL